MQNHPPSTDEQHSYIALIVGNSRLHWAFFIDKTLYSRGDTSHLSASIVKQLAQDPTLDTWLTAISLPANYPIISPNSPIPLILASVVPSQTALWQIYPHLHLITLEDVPLQGMYPTLGIDRALAVWGAGITWGFPTLVIDAGTALTFTGADDHQSLVGGAILPGLGLQFASLGQKTGQLPLLETGLMTSLPPRFAMNTSAAIQSGVIHTLLSGIKDFITAWWQLFPESQIVMTGGDSSLLKGYLQQQFPDIANRLIVDNNLIFQAIGKQIFYSGL
ncbi:pantothenate kinase [Anabaena sp. UHCC 0204]|uniref:pantothenate kinase n=1 Tax=Anabaena sp. UHCC 0204 TaxID=2590009 RepID=UPI0014482529|nr:pantothenate kinase [Anabaena sp. UHCC 0204]